MRNLVMLMVLLAFVSVSIAIAADVVTYEGKKGNVTFDHKAHADSLGDCAKCHDGTPAKIEVDKKYGHKECKGCHKDMSGPTKCNDCHVK